MPVPTGTDERIHGVGKTNGLREHFGCARHHEEQYQDDSHQPRAYPVKVWVGRGCSVRDAHSQLRVNRGDQHLRIARIVACHLQPERE